MPISSESRLTSAPELLHRQAHPAFIRDGRISSAAFRPNSQDNGRLSVSRDSIVSAEEAFRRYTGRGRDSCGVWSVTVGECNSLGLEAYEDGLADDPSHALVDFQPLPSKKQFEKVADKLAALARQRGCQYTPPTTHVRPSSQHP